MSYEISAALRQTEGALIFNLDVFGDFLAEQEGYKCHKGLDAVRFFLMNRYGWLPREVRSMSYDDLMFAIAEEQNGWTLPIDARGAYKMPDRVL